MNVRRLGTTFFPAAIVFVVALMVIPMPPWLLDTLITVNIAVAVLLLLAAIGAKRSLDLAAFPSIILIATLFRLGLNVSSTRLILGEGAAGSVIHAFGSFVISGSLVVGLVVFLILVIIQFVVITNGSNRVAEVAARFTLDAMPGKQMAIDADLNAGIIDDEEATRRREMIASEADFYGAMDGAGKFVKGDAIATVVIVAVNLIGGLVIGVVQQGVPIGEAIQRYSLLTVGDGLVTQIPALLVSIAAGLIVTRSTEEGDLGSEVLQQFAEQHRAVLISGLALLVLGVLPGMPHTPFLMIGAALVALGGVLRSRAAAMPAEAPAQVEEEPPPTSPDSPLELMRTMRVDPIGLELAVDMVDLVDPSVGGDLLDRVRALRRKLAAELGVVLPPVRTTDSTERPLGTYGISLHGVEVASGAAPPHHVLVIDDDLSQYPGELINEPVFGLPAKWIPQEQRAAAQAQGGTVVERAAVITTHLAEVARNQAASLLSRQDVKHLLDSVRESDPAVLEDLTAAQIGVGEVQTVLAGLLDEHVPVRDLVRILEVISIEARTNRDPEHLVEACRRALAGSICASWARDGRLVVLSLDPVLEHHLLERITRTDRGSTLVLDPDLTEALSRDLVNRFVAEEQEGTTPVLVCSPLLRRALQRFMSRLLPHVAVLSHDELAPGFQIIDRGVIRVSTPA